MSVPARITAFAVGLALIFTAATVAGGAVDPDVADDPGPHDMASEGSTEEMTSMTEQPPGLASSHDGYRFAPAATTARSADRVRYEFTILGPGGEPVTDFDVEHERRMHLIVVRRDFAGFQHVHPELAADGTWSVDLDTSLPGTYRVFADFTTAGESMTLGADLSIPGRFDPAPLPRPEPVADAGDGYEVRMTSGEPAGGMTPVEFSVSRNGRPVDGVQPYLGADGHLVVLRQGDLAFLHAHPQGEPGGSGPIAFDVDYPGDGAYRMFLQFRQRGEIRTAAFTTVAGSDGTAPAEGHNENGAEHAH